MSSFLQKLKSGGVTVDNNAPPDNSGMIVRKIEKRFANEPASTLGLKVGGDGEVLAVEPGSAAAKANIPVGFMIFDVNNEFVETNAQFDAVADRSLNLVVKLQSLSSMAELIARILREEESLSIDEVRKKIKLDELARTTPRYNFLASDHPLFRRYTNRLRSKREAAALLRQREREAEERIQRENRERIQKEIEAAKAEAKLAEEKAKAEEEQRRVAQQAPPPPSNEAEQQQNVGFIPVYEDKSTFGNQETPLKEDEAVTQKAAEEVKPKEEEVQIPPATITSETASPYNPVSTAELLALLGKPTDVPAAEESNPLASGSGGNPAPAPDIEDPQSSILGDGKEVRHVILPSEEYTLKSGEKIIASLKSRSGPLPAPPPGKPPKISREAREAMRRLVESRKHDQSESDDNESLSTSSDNPPAKKKKRGDEEKEGRDVERSHRRDDRPPRDSREHGRERKKERERSKDRHRDRGRDGDTRRHRDRHHHHSSSSRRRDRDRDHDRDRDRDRARDRDRDHEHRHRDSHDHHRHRSAHESRRSRH